MPKTLYIEALGEGEITAADIKHDADVEILILTFTLLILMKVQV